jgi:hypothetical protein
MSYTDQFKTSNFRVVLRNDMKNLEFFATEASIPSVTIGTIEAGWQSMKDKRPGDSLDYEPLALTTIVDEDFQIYTDFYALLNTTHNPKTNRIQVTPEVFDLTIFITTNKNNPIYSVTFYDAWIQTISAIELQTISGDDNGIKVTIGISYNYFLLNKE